MRVHAPANAHARVCVCLCVNVCVCEKVYVHGRIHTYIYICVCVYEYLYLYVYVSVYMYVYIYVYIVYIDYYRCMYACMDAWMYGLYTYAHNWFTMILEPCSHDIYIWPDWNSKVGSDPSVGHASTSPLPKIDEKKHGSLQNQENTQFFSSISSLSSLPRRINTIKNI